MGRPDAGMRRWKPERFSDTRVDRVGSSEHPTSQSDRTCRVEPSGRSKEYGRRLIAKAPGYDWKKYYGLKVELGLAISVLMVAALVRAPIQRGSGEFDLSLSEQEVVQIEEIQQTEQQVAPPPPPRPQIPIEVADEELIEDVELNLDVALDIGEATLDMPPPPPADEEGAEVIEEEIFVVVEEMPEIIGGSAKIYEYLEYPPMARQAQIEGLVVVGVVVETDGTGSGLSIMRSASAILDDAAIDAVKRLTFKPGRQRTRPVRVRLAIPIRFQLRAAAGD